MQIHVKTDNHIEGSQDLHRQAEFVVDAALGRFGRRITRVEVHLVDHSSGAKNGAGDIRCAMEARLAGMQPIAVSEQAASVGQALSGAAAKLEKTLDKALERRDSPKGRTPFGGEASA